MNYFKNVLLITVTVFAVGDADARELNRTALTIEVADGGAHTFEVEVANTRRQRRRGLMFRKTLAENRGMLFDFKKEVPISMWMSNTVISLDMLFIGDDGRISSIVESTKPLTRDSIRSEQPVRAVLEVNAGTALELGIKAGDWVRHEIFEKRRLKRKR